MSLQTFNSEIQRAIFPICLSPSAPPVISVSHPEEEEEEVDVEDGAEKRKASEPSRSGADDEPSTSAAENTKEVRNHAYETLSCFYVCIGGVCYISDLVVSELKNKYGALTV